jgi:hypothetical protein
MKIGFQKQAFYNEAAIDWRTLSITALEQQLIFENWHLVLPEDGTHVAKHVEDALFIFV